MKTGKVILICGLPGSGKSTLAQELEKNEGTVRLSPDDWMKEMGVSLWDGKAREGIEQRFWQLAQQLALKGLSSTLENGFWRKDERDTYLNTAREKGFKIELHSLYISKEETRERLTKRGMEGDDEILSDKLDEYYRIFEKPDQEELSKYDS